MLFLVSKNVAKSLKEFVFDQPEVAECSETSWRSWCKILKYSERLGEQKSHLSADRRSLTTKFSRS